MVHYSLPALVLLALSTSVAAFLTTKTTSAAPFNFVQWIEDIITNPGGDHLTPEEAVAAKTAETSADPREKRAAVCRTDVANANAKDAAACLRALASLGARGQNCVIPQGSNAIQMCHIGHAQIVGSKSTKNREGANCNDVAHTGGLIFDSCFRNDGTIRGSDICVGNNQFQVNILAA